jgi:glycine oxidase
MNDRESDVIVIGGGIIGLSVALELQRRGASVHVLERREPGREASWAGAGMLAAQDPDTPECLRELAIASAAMYPKWVADLEQRSGLHADLLREGTIYLSGSEKKGLGPALTDSDLARLETGLSTMGAFAYFTSEASIDPRALMAAAVAAAKKRGVLVSHEHPVTALEVSGNQATGVRVGNQILPANVIINCAGAWAGEVVDGEIHTHPVKGQMLSVVSVDSHASPLKHVVRGDDVYLVPRSDGRIMIGATVERVGFDKKVDSETILKMHRAAMELLPEIGEMRIHETWAGLRPGSPDKLPIVGKTGLKGYFAATGHYRNGILLAPVTARIMADVINGDTQVFDISRFSPSRFS